MKKASELGLETIQLEDQVLLVDKSNKGVFEFGYDYDMKQVCRSNKTDWTLDLFKIVASNKKYEGLPLLVIEDDAEKLSFEEFPISMDTRNNITRDINSLSREPFIKGYNKAKETYKFTEEDMGDLIEICIDIQEEIRLIKQIDVIQRFNKTHKKELWIEVERYNPHLDSDIDEEDYDFAPKITNNQIKAVWR